MPSVELSAGMSQHGKYILLSEPNVRLCCGMPQHQKNVLLTEPNVYNQTKRALTWEHVIGEHADAGAGAGWVTPAKLWRRLLAGVGLVLLCSTPQHKLSTHTSVTPQHLGHPTLTAILHHSAVWKKPCGY